MADPTGYISSFEPANGEEFDSGATVSIKVGGTVTLPGASTYTTWRLTVGFLYYNDETCLSSMFFFQTQTSSGDATPTTIELSPAVATVDDDAGYLVSATLTSEKRKQDGTYEPAIVLDQRDSSFRIGNAGCSLQVYFCLKSVPKKSSTSSSSGGSNPPEGCKAPTPKPGSKIYPGTYSVGLDYFMRVAGNANCTRKYYATFTVRISGPVNLEKVVATSRLNGTQPWKSYYGRIDQQLTKPGEYTVEAKLVAKRIDTNEPACIEEKTYAVYSWSFTVLGSSSSSSSSSSSGGSSSSNSRKSSSSSPPQSSSTNH